MTARILPSFLGQVDGKWYIQVDTAVNTQVKQVGGGGKWEGASAPDNPLVAHLESEVEYLRDQLDKQTQLLAASTKHNTDLIQQLPPPRVGGRSDSRFPAFIIKRGLKRRRQIKR